MKLMQCVHVITLACLVWANQNASARWAVRPKNVPVGRLLTNIETHLKKNPKDAQAHYVLGRLHSMSFALRSDTVEIVEPFRNPKKPNPLPEFAPWRSILVKTPVSPKRTLKIAHLLSLEASLRHYQEAFELDPKNIKARLGLAWMYEAGLKVAAAVRNAPDQANKLPKAKQDRIKALVGGVNRWESNALKNYREVMKLAAAKDIKRGMMGPGADSLMSQDAALGIKRILGKAGRKQAAVEQKELQGIAAHLNKLGRLGRVVTPVIFPLDKPRPLSSLLSTGKTVTFDLDADGLMSNWPWVKPDTGLLVWDPKRTGKIKDGRQLFGSVTWWIFWEHGYKPMAMLDDNRNGWLEGDELNSLSVWQDRNSNGVSDMGEVEPIAKHGIDRLSCQPKGRAGKWNCPTGLEMHDGRRLPTYDWSPESIPASD